MCVLALELYIDQLASEMKLCIFDTSLNVHINFWEMSRNVVFDWKEPNKMYISN